MTTRFVHLESLIDCEWQETPPVYRLYVNDELFSERTWIWQDSILEENIIVSAMPGDFELRYELVEPSDAKLTVGKLRVNDGPAEIVDDTHFRILGHHETI